MQMIYTCKVWYFLLNYWGNADNITGVPKH